MKKKCFNNQNSGFSMVELLAVVAILVILLGISMVSVVRYRDLLKITELDNAAREIYMAAENRAVLLSGARRLSSQVDKSSGKPAALIGYSGHSNEEELYYVSKANMTEDLLKTGSIDPALRKDGVDFYVVYDKNSGSVTDVFYAEESMSGLVGGDFEAFYGKWAKSRSDRLRQKDEMLVGWYNGRAAEGGSFEPDPPKDVPIIRVIIENGEELTVRVEYENVPAPAALSVKLGGVALTNSRLLDVTLPEGDISVPAGNGSYTWVLDSLTGGQFKDLSSGITPGDDFTVEAALTPRNGAPFEAVSDSGTDNSLFQKGSGETTAYIKYLRHLQNLDTAFSGVTGKTSAFQTADIYCHGDRAFEAYKDYNFIPIRNDSLTSYGSQYDTDNSGYFKIYDLNVKDPGKHAGLFSEVWGGMSFRNIRLVNARVDASRDEAGKSCSAGALAGMAAADTVIDNCWVYWEPTVLRDIQESLEGGGDQYDYQIKGQVAGGLIGSVESDTVTITNSLAATLVYGSLSAGGLIGNMEAGSEAEVTHSYADCYLKADPESETETGGGAAGLIGAAGGTVKLFDCYAAGFIMEGNQAAGLCLGGGTTDAANVYSVMRYPGRALGAQFTYLTQNQASDTLTNTYFLHSKTEEIMLSGGKTISGKSFDDMYKSDFVNTMKGSFEGKTPADSHPYELRSVPLVYDYPGLKNLPHYGDWGRELAALSLVYCENDGGTNRVSGIGVRDLNDNTAGVTEDGYALLLRQEDGDEDKTVTVTFSYLDKGGATQTVPDKEYTLTGARPIAVDGDSSNSYYVLPLPDELVNSDYAEEQFFRYIQFELIKPNGAESTPYEGEAFFNPHFAETVQTARRLNEGAVGGWDKESETKYAEALAEVMGEVKVRTPRHLYDLSKFAEYYNNDRQDTFRQMLDLDYSAYTGYNEFIKGEPYSQQPIGKWDEAFTGTYNGDYHVIRNVAPEVSETSDRRYAGLFGYSAGTLRSIVYEMNPEHQVTAYLGNAAQSLYVGALAGGSSGVIDNCAVSGANLRAGASGVVLYVGGLVGRNDGTIRNCAAESARLSANCFSYASVYIGGLVGENASSRSISTSYAVGRIDTEIDNTVKAARVCGFVGWNYGSITNCYAAVDLRSSGENVEAYGFCGMKAGNQSGNRYLDQGNFFYRDASYAAKYAQAGDRAVSTKYAELTAAEMAAGLGMGTVWTGAADPDKEFPYPAAVKDKAGNYVHYGEYPVPMPLGEMGVFYWEKLVDAEGGGNPTYHISALAVDPQKNTITKQSTLSEAHNDGRVVIEYGYGYYSSEDVAASVALEAENIGYTEYVGNSLYNQDIKINGTTYKNQYRLRYKNLHDQIKDGEVHNPDKLNHALYLSQYANNAIPADVQTQFNSDQAASDARSAAIETEAAAGLAELLPGYEFHCWNSYQVKAGKGGGYLETVKNATSGLYLFNKDDTDKVDPNGGSFTLTQSGVQNISVTVGINPHFADALSVKDSGGLAPKGDATGTPLGAAGNPFRVRCGLQLQNINWYDTCFTDVAFGQGNYNDVNRFPYLSNTTGGYHWKQTHDIDWIEEGNAYTEKDQSGNNVVYPGKFMGIAQIKVDDGNLKAWFGGSYNGQNYTIKNLNIGKNASYEPNCIGLFGAVRNATLENMVLFSETGTDIVTVQGRTDTTADNDAWYAGGVLAGLALDSTISNCSVAGYTIRDETTRARSVRGGSGNNRYYTMGGAIGGLVGMTNMELTGCTAAATIEIVCNHQNTTNGSSAPIRVGGLVGSTTGSVTNCYTGGEIKVSARNAAIYAGRLVGGVGMGPFTINNANTETTTRGIIVSNCYSYLTLPGSGTQAVYNIGGAGRAAGAPAGTVTANNDYYYGADVGGGGTSVTYAQLAGQDVITGTQKIYELLTDYHPVTSEIGGLAVSGRFSYAPRNRKDLQGMDYPFPTILTQTRVSDGRVFHVHYGGWELNGIMRGNGNQPIELDMFTKKDYTETLQLSEGVAPGGTWSAEVSVEDIVEASAENGVLTVTALKANDTPVTVTVRYTADGKEYSLPITVYVTANVELRPNAVGVFPNDVVTVPLAVIGRDPDNRDAKDEERPVLEAGGLANIQVNSLDASLAASLAESASITLTPAEAFTEGTRVNVTYDYTRDGYTVTGKTDQITVTLLDLPEGEWNEDGTVWTMDFGSEVSGLKAELADTALTGFTADPDGTGTETAVTLTKTADAEFPEGGVELTVNLTMEGPALQGRTIAVAHELTVTVLPKPPESAEAP